MASSSSKATQSAGACNGTAADFPNIEQELYDYQMHTKMCKKIAQLTKVIYSLNTRHEEQEAALQALRETHQEELRKVAEEAQGNLVLSKGCPEEEAELQKRLQTLEEALEEQQRLKEEVLEEFNSYRLQAEEDGLRLETENADRLAAASRDALDARKDLEVRIQGLSQVKEQLEQERDHALSELELAREECEGLREECLDLQRRISDERGRLEEACQVGTRALREELEGLREEKRELEEHCQRTVNELKEAQQEEQEALRKTLQQSLAEKLSQWQQRDMEQRSIAQASLQQKLKKVEEELEAKQQWLAESRRLSLKLQERSKDMEVQLEEARARAAEAEAGALKAEEELAVAKERLLLQENELQSKSDELLSQCSAQSRASAEAEELRSQVVLLRSRVKELELQSSGKTSDHVRQVKQHAEAMAAQRQDLQRAHVEELRRVRQQMEEERVRVRDQLRKGLEEVMRKHATELRNTQAAADAERRKAQKELQLQAEEFRRRSEEERRELEREKGLLCTRLQESVCEISRLETVIQRAVAEPPEHTAAPCCERCATLSQELEQALQSTNCMKEELVQQREKHQEEISALQQEMKTLEEKILKEAERNQEEKMRAACECLQKELTEQHLLALSQLRKEKEAELEEITEGWRKKMQDLQSQETEEELRAERHAHQLEFRALEERAQAELQAERQRQQAQQKLLLDRQKAELTQQHADWSRQVTQRHMQQIEDLQAELRTHTELVALQQDFKQQNQVQAFERQLDECHSEVMELRRENGELKERLSALRLQVESQLQERGQLQGAEQHHRRCWEEEVECLKREHRKEIQTIVSDFSSAQTRLQARIVSLETELREKDEKSKRRDSRTEDLHIIAKLQNKLSEREQVIKRLLEERSQFQQHLHVSSENAMKACDNRPQPGSLTPTLRKKKVEESPPRVTSVPNLSSYEKCFLGPEAVGLHCQHALKSPSFEHGRGACRSSPSTGAPLPEIRQGPRYSRSPLEEAHQGLDTYSQPSRSPFEQRLLDSGTEVQDIQQQEWLTKHFSF